MADRTWQDDIDKIVTAQATARPGADYRILEKMQLHQLIIECESLGAWAAFFNLRERADRSTDGPNNH